MRAQKVGKVGRRRSSGEWQMYLDPKVSSVEEPGRICPAANSECYNCVLDAREKP
jgi:hypothetical protein